MASQPAADVGQPSGAGTVNWRATDALNAPNCKKMNNHFQNINFKNIAIPLIICISASACGSDESLDGRKFGRDYDNIFLPIDKIVANKSGVLYLSYINNIYGNSKVCINREYSRVKIDNEEIMQIPRVGYVKENSIVISDRRAHV